MTKIPLDHIGHGYHFPQDVANHPKHIVIGGHEFLFRGTEIMNGDNKGVVINFLFDPSQTWPNNYKVNIFWFQGELANEMKDGKNLSWEILEDVLRWRNFEILPVVAK